MKRRPRTRTSPEVELTPLIDVLFLLVVFLVLTTTFVKSQLGVALPEAKGETSSVEPVIIEILADGDFKVDDKVVDEKDLLPLIENMKINKRSVAVAADKRLPYEKVISLLDLLKEAGISEAGLLVEERREN
ncbi:MAG: Biopolymer transport protein ExbD/TolR [Thermovirga lienii]|nr:MAG: Biopolymer transport protein ExbD/TolR [Thermovirga lienii]